MAVRPLGPNFNVGENASREARQFRDKSSQLLLHILHNIELGSKGVPTPDAHKLILRVPAARLTLDPPFANFCPSTV